MTMAQVHTKLNLWNDDLCMNVELNFISIAEIEDNNLVLIEKYVVGTG